MKSLSNIKKRLMISTYNMINRIKVTQNLGEHTAIYLWGLSTNVYIQNVMAHSKILACLKNKLKNVWKERMDFLK